MKLVGQIALASIAVLLTAVNSYAEDPVAYVMDLSGSYISTDSAGVSTPLAVKSPLFNGSVINRTTPKGYLVYLDSNGRVSPSIVESEISIKGRRGIEPKKQAVYLSYIGGTMARSGKGAAVEGLMEWAPEIGAVMERDVADGKMALVFSGRTDSSQTKRYFPLVMKVSPRYRVLRIDYKVVMNTLVTAEGGLEKSGEDWVLPLAAIESQVDETIPLSLTFTVMDTVDRAEKVFTMEAPYMVMADDGFIEGEIRKALDALTQGTDDPDMDTLTRMAKSKVYSDYRLNLYALALSGGQ
jgi:hypothetical protein